MKRVKNCQNGFSAVELILVLIIFGIVGSLGYYVWHAKNNTILSTNTNQLNTKQVGYEDCIKSSGSTKTKFTYFSGPGPYQTKDVSKCITSLTVDGWVSAQTNNLTPTLLTRVDFSKLADTDLKTSILKSDSITQSGCEKNNTIANDDINFWAYAPGKYAFVSPVNCDGTDAIGQQLFVKKDSNWLVIDSINGNLFHCDDLTNYTIPTLAYIESSSQTDCITPVGEHFDLVSGLVH